MNPNEPGGKYEEVLIIWEGPWDMNERPRPANIPRWFPGSEPPPELNLPPLEQPPPASAGTNNTSAGDTDAQESPPSAQG